MNGDAIRSENLPPVQTFADLFCGIGGFHTAAADLGLKCAFACDIDEDAQDAYETNFGVRPEGDIIDIRPDSIPDHDILFAGLPCQPFSIIGKRGGFKDSRGNLFLETARVIAAKKPRAVLIENVRQFTTIQGGKTIRCVVATLEALGYAVDWRILNALDFGLPQKRERVFIVGLDVEFGQFPWPEGGVPMKPLEEILEKNPDPRHNASERIRQARQKAHTAKIQPAVWHENKGGNVSSHPFSCALRAGASYNYLLVDGIRRLTPREMFRLQGFPDSYILPDSVSAARRLAGNSVAVPVVRSVVESMLKARLDSAEWT